MVKCSYADTVTNGEDALLLVYQNQSKPDFFFLFSSKIAMLLLKDLGVTTQTIRSPPHPCPTAVQTDAGNELQPDPNLWQ